MTWTYAVLALSVITWINAVAEFQNDDSIPYSIQWRGPLIPTTDTDDLRAQNVVKLHLKSANNEEYQCLIDSESDSGDKRSRLESYKGPSPSEIMESVIKKNQCTSKLEPFWTYELCHGTTLRQFHEEKNPTSPSGSTVTQEYLLGRYNTDDQPDHQEVINIPSITLEGTDYPYVSTIFSDGTVCDLTGSHRRTKVYYICHSTSHSILYEVKETSTCEYSAIVLISDICSHPAFSPVTETSRIINCHSVSGSPDVPRGQVAFNRELASNLASRKANIKLVKPIGSKIEAPQRMSEDDESGADRRDEPTRETSTHRTSSVDPVEAANREIGPDTDRDLLAQIISGSQCIHGGSGWWSFEYCHSKSVKQYHVDKGKRTMNIVLGTWSESEHLQWLQRYSAKRPKSHQFRKQINLFFSSGDFCTETGHPRNVEVRLKCSSHEGAGSSSHAVAIYMVEPKTCEYILTIESTILCQAVKMADDNGIINMEIMN